MKRIVFITGLLVLVTLVACAKTEEKATAEAVIAPAAASAPEAPAPDGVLSQNYVDAAEALAADNFDKAKSSLSAFAKESTGDLQAKAQTAADANDIVALRKAFKPLSEVAAKMELSENYAVAYCPMFEGGAKWVQKKGDLANPYFGKSMLTCGNFVKTE